VVDGRAERACRSLLVTRDSIPDAEYPILDSGCLNFCQFVKFYYSPGEVFLIGIKDWGTISVLDLHKEITGFRLSGLFRWEGFAAYVFCRNVAAVFPVVQDR